MKRIYFYLILIIIPFTSFSQSDTVQVKNKNHPFISVNYHYGGVIPSNEFVRGDNLAGQPINRYQSGTVKFGWQNPGYTDWQKVYKSPYYGLGFFAGDLFTSEIGYPIAAFGFLGIPLKRWEKLELYSEFQFGLAWHWNQHDSISNPKNISIGSSVTAYVDIGISAFYPLTKHLDLGGGVSFTHFSNGSFGRPNRGLNLYGPFLDLRYHLKERPNVRATPMPGRLERSNNLYFMMGYGDHLNPENQLDSNHYSVVGIGIYYLLQHSNAFMSGPGVDFNFFWVLTTNPDGSPGPAGWDNLTIGLIYQPELIIGRLSLVAGIGIYARHLTYGNFKQGYQRLGVKYQFTDHFSGGVNIRAINFMIAEFIELNLGYRIRWMK